MNSLDGFAQQGGDRKDLGVGQDLVGGEWDRVGADDASQVGCFESLDGWAAEYGVGGGDVDFSGASVVQNFGGTADRAGGADHVVEHQYDFVFNRGTDDVCLHGFFGAGSTFVDDCHFAAESFDMAQRAFDAASVGAGDDKVFAGDVLLEKMLVKNRGCVKVIDGDVEKTLDLGRVEVHRQHAVGACSVDKVGHQFGSDGDAAFVFAVLAGVAKIRDDGRDTFGTGAFATVDHHQQLHQVVVDRRARWLDEVDIAATDILFDLARDFGIRKGVERDIAERYAKILSNALAEFGVGVAAE